MASLNFRRPYGVLSFALLALPGVAAWACSGSVELRDYPGDIAGFGNRAGQGAAAGMLSAVAGASGFGASAGFTSVAGGGGIGGNGVMTNASLAP